MLRRYAAPFAAKQQTPFALPRFRGHLAATRPLWCSQARTAAASAGLQPRCLHATQCNTVAQPHNRTAPQQRIRASPQPETRHTAQPQSNTPDDSTEGSASSLRGWVFLTVTFSFASVGLTRFAGGEQENPPYSHSRGGFSLRCFLKEVAMCECGNPREDGVCIVVCAFQQARWCDVV